MSQNISDAERQQLLATIEMVEQITAIQPYDSESMEILGQAYRKLGRSEDELRTLKRLVAARQDLLHVQVRAAVRATITLCELALERFPDDPELKATLEKLLAPSVQ